MSSTNNKSKLVAKPYNNYNIFFILERELLIQARGKQPSPALSASAFEFNGYGDIALPSFPPRYNHLEVTLDPNWYVAGKKKLTKRKHTKSHGVATFNEIPKIVADNWKVVDPITKGYITSVAALLKERWAQIPAHLKEVPKKKVGRPRKNPLSTQEEEKRRQVALKKALKVAAEPTPSSALSSSSTAAPSSLSTPKLLSMLSTPKPKKNGACNLKSTDFMEECFPTIPVVSPARSTKTNSDVCFDDDLSIDSFHCNLESIELGDDVNVEEEFEKPIQYLSGPEVISSTTQEDKLDGKHLEESAQDVAEEVSEYCEADISDFDILQFYFSRTSEVSTGDQNAFL